MRKLFSRLLLSVLLLLTQQGAMLHELQHVAAGQMQTGGDDEHPAVAGACSLCLAFSPVGVGAAPDGDVVRLVSTVAFVRPAWRATPALAPDVPAPRSRGPPTFV